MKRKNQFFTGVFRVFLISLLGVLLLTLGLVNPARATGTPDLGISMSDSGDFVQGGAGTYTITVTNNGTGPTSGDPNDLVTVDVYNFPEENLHNISISSNDGWACSSIPAIITEADPIRCTRSDILFNGNSYPSIVLSVAVNADAQPSLYSDVDVTGGGDLTAAAAHPVTTVAQKPDLTLTKTHTNPIPAPITGFDFVQGGEGTYTITVNNSNLYAATDDGVPITVTYSLPDGLTLKTIAGTNWDCTVVPTCTRDSASLNLPAGASFEPILLTVNVAWNAIETVVNAVSVSGGGEVNIPSENNLETKIEQRPDLDITNVSLVPPVPFVGQDFSLHVTGVNQGGVATGTVVSAYAFVDPDTTNSAIWPVPCGWDPNDYNLYHSDLVNDTAVLAGVPFERDIPIAGGLSEGIHNIYIYTDPGCSIYESNENNNRFDLTNINIHQPVSISGNVGLAGVSLRYVMDGVTRSTTSNINGNYAIYVPLHWTGTVTPIKAGYVFSPLFKNYTDLTVNQANQNFITRPGFASVGTLDGWVLESSENSNQGGAINSASGTLVLGDNAARKQFRSILSFNTASLPDNAVITSATLRIRRGTIIGGVNPLITLGGFMVDIRRGIFGTSAALQLGDFQYPKQLTVGPFRPAFTNGWYFINLTSAKAYVNKLGNTQIRLRFRIDDNNNAIANYMNIYSGNAGIVVYRPMLFINYTIP